MPFKWDPAEHLHLARHFLKWLAIGVPTGMIIGSAVAGFLWLLGVATQFRYDHPWMLWLLPAGGIGVGWLYHRFGRSVEGGNNLLMDEIHRPGGGVPIRMAPIVLIGTVLTHLFGGSAGREGTAVQMGGSLAGGVARRLRLGPVDTRTLLTAGIAGGFGAVFGTPLTGAVFAVEVLAIGLVSFDAIVPCLIASVAGDLTVHAWHVHHTAYPLSEILPGHVGPLTESFELLMLAKVSVAAVTFGLASVIFAELTHGLHRAFKGIVPSPIWRPAVGGVIVIGLTFCVGPDYLGLGVPADLHRPGGVSLTTCFTPGGAHALSWWWKILFTAVTLSSGFKGGEVTPLFFIGAALGNVIARLLHAPVGLFAGLGFVGVFAGATNTPLACTVMAIELFGPAGGAGLLSDGFVVYAAVACFVAYLFSGHSGIYLSQRIGRPKGTIELPADADLRSVRSGRRAFGR